MIPYQYGRSDTEKRIVKALNAGATYIAVTPAEIAAINAIKAANPTLLQAQKAIPSIPAGFIPYKLGAPPASIPLLSNAICWFGSASQTGTNAPALNEVTASGMILTPARTSAGFYTVTGFPTGYTLHAAVEPSHPNKVVTTSVTGQTVTIKTYDGGVIGDNLLNGQNFIFVLIPT